MKGDNGESEDDDDKSNEQIAAEGAFNVMVAREEFIREKIEELRPLCPEFADRLLLAMEEEE